MIPHLPQPHHFQIMHFVTTGLVTGWGLLIHGVRAWIRSWESWQ